MRSCNGQGLALDTQRAIDRYVSEVVEAIEWAIHKKYIEQTIPGYFPWLEKQQRETRRETRH